MREFNTTEHNIPSRHYTVERTNLIEKGISWLKTAGMFDITNNLKL